MQKAKLMCLLLIANGTHLCASDKETPPEKPIDKKPSYSTLAGAALRQSPNAGTLQKQTEQNAEFTKRTTPSRPYRLTPLQKALIIPSADSGLIKQLDIPGWSFQDLSSEDEQWCPYHDRNEACDHCVRPSYRCNDYGNDSE